MTDDEAVSRVRRMIKIVRAEGLTDTDAFVVQLSWAEAVLRVVDRLACDACEGSGRALDGPCGCKGDGLVGMLLTVRTSLIAAERDLNHLAYERDRNRDERDRAERERDAARAKLAALATLETP